MTKPLISVVIPAYNAEKTIEATIESVLNQSYTAIELIVVDDGSIDKTVNVVWRMRPKCNQHGIKLHLVAQQNSGVSVARNRGVQEAQGDLIAFLDADDEWLENKLSCHATHIQRSPEVGLSFAKVNFLTTKGSLRTSSKLPNRELKAEDCLSANPTISPSNWVMKKSVFQQLNGFDESMTHAEDQEFLIRLLRDTEFKIKGIEHVLVNYATSQEGLSADIDSMYEGWQALIESLRDKNGLVENYASHHMSYCLFLAKRTVHISQDYSLGFKYLSRAMVAAPLEVMLNPKQAISIFIGLMYGCINVARRGVARRLVIKKIVSKKNQANVSEVKNV